MAGIENIKEPPMDGVVKAGGKLMTRQDTNLQRDDAENLKKIARGLAEAATALSAILEKQ
jgi:hypothetical protein